jgi:tripartite-type tricarboxylate transporter receptor subunit TctC
MRARLARLFSFFLAFAFAGAAAPVWSADAYPSKPIRIIIPFGAGGTTDVVARLVVAKLSESLKQTVNVEPTPGANGIIGTDTVAEAAPDGYTLLMTVASTQTLTSILYKTPYNPVKDFASISLVANPNGVFVVNAALPVRTMQEFAAESHKRPDGLSYGAGTALLRLIGEQLTQLLQANLMLVPYKGTAPQLAAVVGGEVDSVVDPFIGIQHVKSGKLRALAVMMPKRSPLLPDVPTFEEAGIKGITLDSWIAFFAPAGTPPESISKLSAEVKRIVGLDDVRERLAQVNYDSVGAAPAEHGRTVEADMAKWQRIGEETNYKAED